MNCVMLNFSCESLHEFYFYVKLDSLDWFSQHRAEHKSYVHAASDVMFRRPASLCLRLVSCVATQQNATFLGVAHRLCGTRITRTQFRDSMDNLRCGISFSCVCQACTAASTAASTINEQADNNFDRSPPVLEGTRIDDADDADATWSTRMTPKFELGRDFCTMHLPPSFTICVYPFGSYRLEKHTNQHTNKQIPLKTSNILRYATMLGNNFAC